ncbi:phosphatidylserine decarboxylase [Panus rudis PR-1116 ss-1]|nr:phosphatidylserine decarboxylase [Panus rudis PR-1116 ss-1]
MLSTRELMKKNLQALSHARASSQLLSSRFICRSLLQRLQRRSDHRPYSSPPPSPPPPGDFGGKDTPLHKRLGRAWSETPTKWYPLPLAAGALLLIILQYRKRASAEPEVHLDEDGHEVVKLKGPWQVYVIGALPLRNLSRVWGYLNSLELPVWFRPIGFRVYSWIFGCNLDEIDPEDLKSYKSLGDFFYRRLKDGVRPISNTVLVSPADGRILHFGTVTGRRVEQVKGSTYSLDALLGFQKPATTPGHEVQFPARDLAEVEDKHFADINGIEYSLNELLGTGTTSSPTNSGTSTPVSGDEGSTKPQPQSTSQHVQEDVEAGVTSPTGARKYGERVDASIPPETSYSPDTVARHASVAADMGVRPSLERQKSASASDLKPGNSLFFAVIYLAPGDYHRFHSPTSWVVEKRRHFVGDLFSVSPWMARRLPNLFVLNERVALLGRWRYGFFSMVPVGATNVGSIRINFDQALRTNVGRHRDHPLGTYTEAVYSHASPILNGQPLTKGQEMGGFCLGSTIVLVFEAPQDFVFTIKEGQKIKVGEAMGDVAANLTNSDTSS